MSNIYTSSKEPHPLSSSCAPLNNWSKFIFSPNILMKNMVEKVMVLVSMINVKLSLLLLNHINPFIKLVWTIKDKHWLLVHHMLYHVKGNHIFKRIFLVLHFLNFLVMNIKRMYPYRDYLLILIHMRLFHPYMLDHFHPPFWWLIILFPLIMVLMLFLFI